MRTRFILCQGLLKQSFLTLQLVTRQQDQEFDQQCIVPVYLAAVTTHIIIQIVHIPFHQSHPSTLKYLRSTQTHKERPQLMTKDITAKSNNKQDLGNKIRYSKIFYAACSRHPKGSRSAIQFKAL